MALSSSMAPRGNGVSWARVLFVRGAGRVGTWWRGGPVVGGDGDVVFDEGVELRLVLGDREGLADDVFQEEAHGELIASKGHVPEEVGQSIQAGAGIRVGDGGGAGGTDELGDGTGGGRSALGVSGLAFGPGHVEYLRMGGGRMRTERTLQTL